MSTFELLGLFYSLPGYLCWNPDEKRVVFDNQESAVAFKRSAPDWHSYYTVN